MVKMAKGGTIHIGYILPYTYWHRDLYLPLSQIYSGRRFVYILNSGWQKHVGYGPSLTSLVGRRFCRRICSHVLPLLLYFEQSVIRSRISCSQKQSPGACAVDKWGYHHSRECARYARDAPLRRPIVGVRWHPRHPPSYTTLLVSGCFMQIPPHLIGFRCLG